MDFSALNLESDGNKSPEPDDFNFAFFKQFSYPVKNEVKVFFDQFHGNEVFPKSLLSYFVTLIPKVLVRRLSKVMNSVISNSQSAFFKGRNLVDGVMIVNEVLDMAKKRNRECLILKVDFEKAGGLEFFGIYA